MLEKIESNAVKLADDEVDRQPTSFLNLSMKCQENIVSFLDANSRGQLLRSSKDVSRSVYSTCFHELPFSIRKGYNPLALPHLTKYASFSTRLGHIPVIPYESLCSDGILETETLSLAVLKRAMKWWIAIELTVSPRMIETGSMIPVQDESVFGTITTATSNNFRILTRCSTCLDATEISVRQKDIPHLVICGDCVTFQLFKRDALLNIWKLTSEQIQSAGLPYLDTPIQTTQLSSQEREYHFFQHETSKPTGVTNVNISSSNITKPYISKINDIQEDEVLQQMFHRHNTVMKDRINAGLPLNVSSVSKFMTSEQFNIFDKKTQSLSSLPRGNVSSIFAFWDVFPTRICAPLLQPRGAHTKITRSTLGTAPNSVEPTTPHFVTSLNATNTPSTAFKIMKTKSTTIPMPSKSRRTSTTYVINGKRRKLFGAARSSVLAAEARNAAAAVVASKIKAAQAGTLVIENFDVEQDVKTMEEVQQAATVTTSHKHHRPHGFQSAEAAALHIPSSTPIDSDLYYLTRVDPKKLGIDVAAKIESYINDPNRVVYAGTADLPAESALLRDLDEIEAEFETKMVENALKYNNGNNGHTLTQSMTDIDSVGTSLNGNNSNSVVKVSSTIKPSKTLQRTIDTFVCLPLMVYRRYVQCSCGSLETCAESHPHWQEDLSVWPKDVSYEKVEIALLHDYGLDHIIQNGLPKSKYSSFVRSPMHITIPSRSPAESTITSPIAVSTSSSSSTSTAVSAPSSSPVFSFPSVPTSTLSATPANKMFTYPPGITVKSDRIKRILMDEKDDLPTPHQLKVLQQQQQNTIMIPITPIPMTPITPSPVIEGTNSYPLSDSKYPVDGVKSPVDDIKSTQVGYNIEKKSVDLPSPISLNDGSSNSNSNKSTTNVSATTHSRNINISIDNIDTDIETCKYITSSDYPMDLDIDLDVEATPAAIAAASAISSVATTVTASTAAFDHIFDQQKKKQFGFNAKQNGIVSRATSTPSSTITPMSSTVDTSLSNTFVRSPTDNMLSRGMPSLTLPRSQVTNSKQIGPITQLLSPGTPSHPLNVSRNMSQKLPSQYSIQPKRVLLHMNTKDREKIEDEFTLYTPTNSTLLSNFSYANGSAGINSNTGSNSGSSNIVNNSTQPSVTTPIANIPYYSNIQPYPLTFSTLSNGKDKKSKPMEANLPATPPFRPITVASNRASNVNTARLYPTQPATNSMPPGLNKNPNIHVQKNRSTTNSM